MSSERITDEPTVTFATVRNAEDELHIECRFSDGQKFAAVTVAQGFDNLAHRIEAMLNGAQQAPTAQTVVEPVALPTTITDEQLRDALRSCGPVAAAALRPLWPYVKQFGCAIFALRTAAQPVGEWIDARKVMPPPSKWPKRYLVILDSESPTQHCKDWAGRGEPEIAAFCSQWPYPWNARGGLSVAYWMPLPEFLKRWDQTVEGKPGRWIDAHPATSQPVAVPTEQWETSPMNGEQWQTVPFTPSAEKRP